MGPLDVERDALLLVSSAVDSVLELVKRAKKRVNMSTPCNCLKALCKYVRSGSTARSGFVAVVYLMSHSLRIPPENDSANALRTTQHTSTHRYDTAGWA